MNLVVFVTLYSSPLSEFAAGCIDAQKIMFTQWLFLQEIRIVPYNINDNINDNLHEVEFLIFYDMFKNFMKLVN